jgi:hypothetical protein
VPDDDDKPFVIFHQVKVDEDENPQGPPIGNQQFRFSISFDFEPVTTKKTTRKRKIQTEPAQRQQPKRNCPKK